jgi:hypothetical protein
MLYRVQKGDIMRAGKVLADAFQHDPVWNKLFEGESDLEKRFFAFSEVAVRYGLKYGEGYAPSEAMEGVVAWVPGKYADMNAWRMIRSGGMRAGMRMGLNVMKKMGVLKPLDEDRHEHMAGTTYLYLLIIQVHRIGIGCQCFLVIT